MHPKCEKEIKKALEVLRAGGVIVYPTDTIWGIGCDATNAEAVKKVYEIKRREDSKALICLVDSADRAQRYVREIPSVGFDMMDLTTTPLTIIFDQGKNLAKNLLAEDGSIALRVTAEEFSHELCYRLQKPLVSTSANISGEPSPRNFSEISEEVLSAVDYVVDWRRQEKEKCKPSGIVKLGANGEIKIIRQ
jgi:L-threonylcarbamoyladenylate synthase